MSHITGKDWQNNQSVSVKKSDPNTPEWTQITICNCKRDLQRFISCFSFAVNTPVVYLHAIVALGTGHTWYTPSCTIAYVAESRGNLFKGVMAFFGQVSHIHVILQKNLLQSLPYKWRQSHWGNYFPDHSGDINRKTESSKVKVGFNTFYIYWSSNSGKSASWILQDISWFSQIWLDLIILGWHGGALISSVAQEVHWFEFIFFVDFAFSPIAFWVRQIGETKLI